MPVPIPSSPTLTMPSSSSSTSSSPSPSLPSSTSSSTSSSPAPSKPPTPNPTDTASSSSPTPLPTVQLSLLGCCLYGVLFSQNVLFPFLPFMVQSFFPQLPLSALGYRAGYLGAAFPAGLAVSSYLWGRVADSFGRKVCLLFGLTTTSVLIVAFGFSGSFEAAVILRFASGALNGNNAIVKAMVSEVCDDSNVARGFSVIGLLGGLARLTSPGVGGLLAEPAAKGKLLEGVGWLERYPYALPCLVGGVIAAVSAVLVAIGLNETLPGAQVGVGEVMKRVKDGLTRRARRGYDRVGVNAEDDRRSPNHRSSPAPSAASPSPPSPPQPSIGILSLLSQHEVAVAIYLNAIMGYLAISHTEVIPLWLVVDAAHGGLSLRPTAIASLLMALGPFQMAHQLLLYPRLTQRWGPKRLFRGALTVVGVTCVIMPFNVYWTAVVGGVAGEWVAWGGVVATFIVMVLARVTCFTSTFILLNNSAETRIKGSANGLAQSFASIAGIIGPIVGGTVFAWSSAVGRWPVDFTLVWLLMAAVCAVGVGLAGTLPDSIDKKKTDEDAGQSGTAEGKEVGVRMPKVSWRKVGQNVGKGQRKEIVVDVGWDEEDELRLDDLENEADDGDDDSVVEISEDDEEAMLALSTHPAMVRTRQPSLELPSLPSSARQAK